MSFDVEPFVIAVPQVDVDELARRLAATRWPPELEGIGWQAGIDRGYVRGLVQSWARDFDWRAQERWLNSFPHARAVVAGERLHFVQVPGVGPDPLPLVLTHGWPSSFAEYLHVLGPLTDPAAHGGDPADAFTVVIPSLPGYGFSDPPARPGTAAKQIAERWVELMAGLGFERYAAAGCDWGAVVTSALGILRPEALVGIHLGMVTLGGARRPDEAPFDDSAWLERTQAWSRLEQGYVAEQSTKPETLALGLTDSPVGLAGWIAEKWASWSDHAGDPAEAISRQDLLTAISLYWFTGTIGSSMRLYYENRRAPVVLGRGERVEVPAGFLLEPCGLDLPGTGTLLAMQPGPPSRIRAERAYDVRRWTVPERGCHFPALENPDLYVHELREMFRPLR
ncbi:MAG: multidrug transporter [Frankiales bacterium]|nr:multidrug transporter [Frankiales bacterium]